MNLAVTKDEISNTVFKFFADYIYKHSGMVYTDKDYYRLETRLRSLVKIFEVEAVDDLYKKFQGPISPDMHTVLINISTNNETYFFRDKRPFSILTNELLPIIMENKKMAPISIWSAASSTGQEIYSIIMQIKEKIPELIPRLVIDASDISTDALAKAKKGNYNGLDVQRGLPITTLMKYFEQQEDESWQIAPELSRIPNFFEFNLLTGSFPLMRYDIIFCRNVLIYQNMENKQKIVSKLYESLRPGGFLVLGNGESFIGLETDFQRETYDNLTVYAKKA
ncbi:protein-glutamate O-methyltransferase CheR [Halobacteriovorax sp. HLS]|uniref:CheR family methyltransferase n=1 Tax=Halobacteriovorax sp. HLS TaxID=2234000 RepID=UPI000FD956D7|nr:protein-glutamate O-methyltransferase CheR [Halobacteriovorax sp. HLS]